MPSRSDGYTAGIRFREVERWAARVSVHPGVAASMFRQALRCWRSRGRAMSRPRETTCRSCKAPIFWTMTEDRKRMPMDAKPVPGMFAVNAHDLATKANVFQSHFATCPNADAHRR